MKTLQQIRQAIAKHATANSIKTVHLFGSYADGTATDTSDIDLLVEYNQPPTLLNYLGFKEQLQNELSTEVDIIQSPIDHNKLLFPSFQINKTIPLYG